MGWKTPKIEYVNGYKIIEVDGPAFKVYEGDRQLGDDFPYFRRSCCPRELPSKAGSSTRLIDHGSHDTTVQPVTAAGVRQNCMQCPTVIRIVGTPKASAAFAKPTVLLIIICGSWLFRFASW